jgi:hypothetical protein
MPRRSHKVLLVGAKGYQQTAEGVRVDCRLWSALKKLDNIRDYDTIIVDLLELQSEEAKEAVDWLQFHQLFNFPNAVDVLTNGGAIIVIGDPRLRIPFEQAEEPDSGSAADQPFLRWTGIKFAWDPEPGDTVHFVDDYQHRSFERYVSKLKKWQYSLAKCEVDREVLPQQFNMEIMMRKNFDIGIEKDFFCVNRYQHGLVFTLRLQYLKRGRNEQPEVMDTHGPLIFLPEVGLSHDEIRQVVLADICGVQASIPEPDWINEFSAPGQTHVDNEIKRIEADLEAVAKKLQSAHGRRTKARECLKLLYEREFALEPVTRDILRGLGAHVEDPSESNKEDGWLVVRVGEKTYEAVLEIKSTRGDQFGEDGRKQLLDWIDRGRTLRGKNYKGIFIGSSAVDKPFKERPWAYSDSWTKAATLSGICAMKTEDLYVIHLLHAKGEINLDTIWEEVFDTNGIFHMKRYWDLLSPKDNG